LDIAADFAKQERYELQPSKTNTIRIKPSNRTSKGKPTHPLKLNGSDIQEVEEATHIGLGLLQCPKEFKLHFLLLR
jgi:hypothetical protein